MTDYLNGEPISPDQIGAGKATLFPTEVINAVNALLIAGACGKNTITIKQNDIIDLALENFSKSGNIVDRQIIFEKGWLNIEDLYRSKGWLVEYDKPGYNEFYGAFFKFRPK